MFEWMKRKKPSAAPAISPNIAPKVTRASRMYHSAKSSRLTAGWQETNSSSDSELVTSLTKLRSRSRALVRDASYAKRARVLVVNNVVGTGIGMQAQVHTARGVLNKSINQAIEREWNGWCSAKSCHTGGRLHFSMLERALVGQVFEAGEVLLRKHYQPFGNSRVPFALEMIESERVADEFMSPYLEAKEGFEIRMGVEVDDFQRPVAYWIRKRHPNEHRFTTSYAEMVERVPAEDIIHLALIDRWPQTRGEPWLHAVARRLNDMDGYSEAEIVRARAQAMTPGAIETPEDPASFGERTEDGAVEMELEPGVYKRLLPGEKLVPGTVTAPNPALDPFMRYMLREIAAGVGTSYESLSRDYSQSNYSSSRLALLDDRDVWRVLQSWFIKDFRALIHKEWLQAAVLSRAIPEVSIEQYVADRAKFEAVRFKPRGWSWVDPTKEVAAYKEAIKAGLTTVTDVIASTAGGLDVEDVLETRKQELEMMEEAGLVFDTSPDVYVPAPAPEVSDDELEDEEESDPPVRNVTQLR